MQECWCYQSETWQIQIVFYFRQIWISRGVRRELQLAISGVGWWVASEVLLLIWLLQRLLHRCFLSSSGGCMRTHQMLLVTRQRKLTTTAIRQTHGLTSTPITSVLQKSDISTGVANLTWQIKPLTGTSSVELPNITHPSGVFLATKWPHCFVWPVCICAWSIPIRRLMAPWPLQIFSLSSPRSLVTGLTWTADTSSLMEGILITLMENICALSGYDTEIL